MRYQRFGFMKQKVSFGNTVPFVPLTISVTEDMTGNDVTWGADGSSALGARARLNYSNISYAVDTNRPNASIFFEFTGNITSSDFADNSINGNVTFDSNGNATISKSISSNVALGDKDFRLVLKTSNIGDTIFTGNQKFIYKVEPPTITGGDIQTITTQSGVNDITMKSRIHTFDRYLTGNVNYTIKQAFANSAGGWTGDHIIFNETFTTAGEQHTFSGVTDPNWTFLNGNTYVLRSEFSGATLYNLANDTPIVQATTSNLSLTGNVVAAGPTAESLTVTDYGSMGSNVYNIIFTGTVNTPAGDDDQTIYFDGAGNGANKLHTLVVGAGGKSLGGANVSNGGGGGGNVSTSAVEITGFTANTAYNMIPGFSNTSTHDFGPDQDDTSIAYDNDANLKLAAVGGQPSTNASGGDGGSSGLVYNASNVLQSFNFTGGSASGSSGGGGAGFGNNGSSAPNSTTGGDGGDGKTYVSSSGVLTRVLVNPLVDYSNTTGYANVGVSAGGGGKGTSTNGSAGFTGNVDFGTGALGGGVGASNGVIIVRYAYSDGFRFISNTEIT